MLHSLSLVRDARRVRNGGEIASRQRMRVAEMVQHTRRQSPFYAEFYKDLPARVDDARALPVTDKAMLMAGFNRWVTDPEVAVERVRSFVADPGRAGERFLGRYTVATTSERPAAPVSSS